MVWKQDCYFNFESAHAVRRLFGTYIHKIVSELISRTSVFKFKAAERVLATVFLRLTKRKNGFLVSNFSRNSIREVNELAGSKFGS